MSAISNSASFHTFWTHLETPSGSTLFFYKSPKNFNLGFFLNEVTVYTMDQPPHPPLNVQVIIKILKQIIIYLFPLIQFIKNWKPQL